jgi:DNA ligase-1
MVLRSATDAAAVVVLVRTEKVFALADFRRLFSEFVEAGYEGIMLRNADGVYRANYRSNDLQKYKEFEEAEFVIVGFEEARGRDAGSVLWVCATSSGDKFDCRPIGSLEHRSELFRNAPNYVGKLLTVKYQELSEHGIPRFPSGKAIREGY